MCQEQTQQRGSTDQVRTTSHNETAPVAASEIMSLQGTERAAKEKEMGFAFTACFKCGRVDIAQCGNRTLPQEVKGECEADNGIVMTLCGLCRGMKGGDDDIRSFCLHFSGLKLSPEIFEGSRVHRIASAVLSEDVAFITEGGGVAYIDVNTIVTSLGKGDRLMSVDVEKFKREKTGLTLPYLEGRLIPSVGREKPGKEEVDRWGGTTYNNRMFGGRR